MAAASAGRQDDVDFLMTQIEILSDRLQSIEEEKQRSEEQLLSKIQQLHRTSECQERTLAAQHSQLQAQEQRLQLQEQQLRLQERRLQEQEQRQAESGQRLQEQEQRQAECDQHVQQWDQQLQEHALQLQMHEEQQPALLQGGDLDERLERWDRQLQQQARQLQAHDQHFESLDSQLRDHEEQLERQHDQIEQQQELIEDIYADDPQDMADGGQLDDAGAAGLQPACADPRDPEPPYAVPRDLLDGASQQSHDVSCGAPAPVALGRPAAEPRGPPMLAGHSPPKPVAVMPRDGAVPAAAAFGGISGNLPGSSGERPMPLMLKQGAGQGPLLDGAGPPKLATPKKSAALWDKVLELCAEQRFLDAYKQVIAEPDESCLLRLMQHTGPVVRRLDAESNSRLIRRLIHILSSQSTEPAAACIDQIFSWFREALSTGIHFTPAQVEDLATALQRVATPYSFLAAPARADAAQLLARISALRRV